MNAPADAARDPDGPTQQITGTRDRWIALMMERIDESSPPGVSMRTSTAAAWWSRA
jgi:hypothetical protein